MYKYIIYNIWKKYILINVSFLNWVVQLYEDEELDIEDEELDIYSRKKREKLVDDDELTPEEEGFMLGWEEAG